MFHSYSKPDDLQGGKIEGEEDCLVLNVHAREIPKGKPKGGLKTVMVYIHGGGYMMGSGMPDLYGPDKFIEEDDIVYVALNYRLGALGFLSMGDNVLPGNMGLWDQRMALSWVQENIEAFGGDPNKVGSQSETCGS